VVDRSTLPSYRQVKLQRALDVLKETAKNNKLLLNNVIATPHMGAQTHEAQFKASIQIAKAVIEALEKPVS
jgi:phosphoglycerate dehydrogenase-like enzyme